MPDHYGPIDNCRFTPMNLMNPKIETIPTNERLMKIGKDFAMCAFKAKMDIWRTSSDQWDASKEGNRDAV